MRRPRPEDAPVMSHVLVMMIILQSAHTQPPAVGHLLVDSLFS